MKIMYTLDGITYSKHTIENVPIETLSLSHKQLQAKLAIHSTLVEAGAFNGKGNLPDILNKLQELMKHL